MHPVLAARTSSYNECTGKDATKWLRGLEQADAVKHAWGVVVVVSLPAEGPQNYTPLGVRVLYGATGTGKTARAMALTQRAYKWGPHNGAWFDGY